jgi:hypothetical protein
MLCVQPLQVAALCFFKVCVSCGSVFTQYLIEHRLLAPVVQLVKDIGGVDNILQSTAIGVFQCVR